MQILLPTLGAHLHLSTFTIGGAFEGANRHMNGDIDEIGIWSRIITSGEVTSLYNSGAGLAYPFTGGGATNNSSMFFVFA